MFVSRTVHRKSTHSVATLDTGNGDRHLVWYIGCPGVVSVGICMHAGLGIGPLYVWLPCFIRCI